MPEMNRILCGLAVAACAATTSVAAQDAAVPAFDVISIKPQEVDASFIPSSPTLFVDANATLRSLITWAWNVRSFQVDGGPDWAGSRRFDVSARSPRPVSERTMRLMVRQLLADRFQLRSRVEPREMARYVLRAARPDGRLGPGLQPARIDCAAVLAERFGAPAPPGSSAPPCSWRVGIAPPVARMVVDGAPMAEFAGLLERLLNRKVADGTGLKGTYDIRLEFSADQLPMAVPPAGDAPPAPTRDGLSLFTALNEQLGLTLESEHGPVEVIVIESAQLPAPN
jgi:uncharacterized protein (TIGR03435 family)